MVTIINYKEMERPDYSTFFLLELQGGIEMVLSKETNRFYATAKRAHITTTFDELTCKALIGTQMKGNIVKQECDPYMYVVKETGEEITLTHRYIYDPVEAAKEVKVEPSNQMPPISKNGVSEQAFAM